jgi:tetratricopeptide (TPR) repeat protein
MGRLDWCQKTSWNADVEAAFFDRLARARNKVWYLRIQASWLVSSHPEVALRLLDRYFALGADTDEAEAHFNRGRAYAALRNMDAALAAFEAALAREDAYPLFRTWAFIELPALIAVERKSALYDRAVAVLTMHKDQLTFPVQYYKWYGALALIADAQGRRSEAQAAARQALNAANMTHSGFRHHPDVGLVADRNDALGTRLKAIGGDIPAKARWWRR